MSVIRRRYKLHPSKNLLNDLNYLYRKHYQDTKSILKKWRCNTEVFNDIYQDAFIILMEKLKHSGSETIISSGYIVNLCKYLWFKERKRLQDHEPAEQVEKMDEHYTETKDVMNFLLLKHMKNLSADCRKILNLYLKNYTEQKISEVLHLEGPKAVNNQKHYCKSKLRSLIMNDPLFKEIHG